MIQMNESLSVRSKKFIGSDLIIKYLCFNILKIPEFNQGIDEPFIFSVNFLYKLQ